MVHATSPEGPVDRVVETSVNLDTDSLLSLVGKRVRVEQNGGEGTWPELTVISFSPSADRNPGNARSEFGTLVGMTPNKNSVHQAIYPGTRITLLPS